VQGSLTAVPFRSLQLDSWWYFQDNNTGLMNWTARPDALPLGLPALHNDAQWPLILHNRWFSCRTSKHNGGRYDFLLEPESMPGAQGAAMPLSQACWDDLQEWDMISPEAKECNQAMLQRDLKSRPTAPQLLGMPWLAKTAPIMAPMSQSSSSFGSMTNLSSAQPGLADFNEKRAVRPLLQLG